MARKIARYRLAVRHRGVLVLDEISQQALSVIPHRHLERDRLLRDLERLSYLLYRKVQGIRKLLGTRLLSSLPPKVMGGPAHLVGRLHHVHRHPYRAGLVRDG